VGAVSSVRGGRQLGSTLVGGRAQLCGLVPRLSFRALVAAPQPHSGLQIGLGTRGAARPQLTLGLYAGDCGCQVMQVAPSQARLGWLVPVARCGR
jgi:glycine cleavage system aminomethyltransferase T